LRLNSFERAPVKRALRASEQVYGVVRKVSVLNQQRMLEGGRAMEEKREREKERGDTEARRERKSDDKNRRKGSILFFEISKRKAKVGGATFLPWRKEYTGLVPRFPPRDQYCTLGARLIRIALPFVVLHQR
jgi:hypothetical protein